MLIRNDKPFEVKGAAGNSHLQELKEAGGNTIRLYDTIDLRKNLDAAHELGLAAIVDIPLPKHGDGSYFYEKDLTAAKRKISAVVLRHKDHPALLYWNVGNELYYPTFYQTTKFFDSFNSLVDLVKKTDPDHPVSTAIIGGNRRRLASVALKSPNLDLISINSFGNLTELKERMEPIKLLWDGPYVITEWGVNGPWEEARTMWGAPIEQNSVEKARILGDRYNTAAIQSPNCLGSVVFFWGTKQERTHTWFSFFWNNNKSETYNKIKSLWNKDPLAYNGPRMGPIKIEKLDARSNVILSTGVKTNATVSLEKSIPDSLKFTWEIRKEAWSKIEEQQPIEKDLILENSGENVVFKAPQEEGPYRLFVYVTDDENNFSTTNIPFYVLNPENGE
ncbi:glycoside hydrolase family 2 TIM barrel-domain containing protein [Salinimicrobium catena]|nr:glycoside hydrolase family 2 TIM barrel-domain containing protein [Salinimicrobium catena]